MLGQLIVDEYVENSIMLVLYMTRNVRKEIAGIFRISLVTLHDWMKRGLPSHKQRGRVYFLRSEVIAYVKQNRRSNFLKSDQWKN